MFEQPRRSDLDGIPRTVEFDRDDQLSLLLSPVETSSDHEASSLIPGSSVPSGSDGQVQSGGTSAIREKSARAAASGVPGTLEEGSESFFDRLGEDRVLKTVEPKGIWTYRRSKRSRQSFMVRTALQGVVFVGVTLCSSSPPRWDFTTRAGGTDRRPASRRPPRTRPGHRILKWSKSQSLN